jgi:hypothetical protein
VEAAVPPTISDEQLRDSITNSSDPESTPTRSEGERRHMPRDELNARTFRAFELSPDGRKPYVEAFFRNLDWDHVNRQLIHAEAANEGADHRSAREPAHTH